ncbi:hypothetical protein A2U01_0054739, partial [Trifolium medium]|nr:hypothetical protein [Trifolium medium]
DKAGAVVKKEVKNEKKEKTVEEAVEKKKGT